MQANDGKLLEPRNGHGRGARNDGTIDTLVVSDVHLGLKNSRAAELIELLSTRPFRRLILLGDVFHDFAFERISSDSWKLIQHLRLLAHERHSEIVCVHGNHDRRFADAIARLVGVPVVESYRWAYGGRSYLAIHGDRFDGFLSANHRIDRIFSRLFALSLQWLSKRGEWPMRLDAWHVRFTGLTDKVAQGAVAYANSEAADVILCGHTHEPHRRIVFERGKERPIEYVNTGAWITRPASFVTVGALGVHINHWP